MERVQIQTAQNVDIDFEVAGVGDRVIAALIDYFLLGAYLILVQLINLGVQSHTFVFVMMLPAMLYFLICEVFLDGQSIGKRARHIKAVRLDGGQPTLGNYLLRWLLRPIDIWLTTGSAAIITMLVNGQGQRLGDLAAGTTVVKVRPRVSLRDTVLTNVEDDYVPTFYTVERLSDEDITTAKEVLDALAYQGKTYDAVQLSRTMKAVLEQRMGTSSDLPPPQFLRTVVKDYNHLKGGF